MRARAKNQLDPRLIDVFCGVFGKKYRKRLTSATSMDDVKQWDSTSFLDLVFAIEQEYGVEFTPDESAQMFQLGHIQRLIDSAVLDLPHDDVSNACCLMHGIVATKPSQAPNMVILSGSSTREGLLRPRQAEAMLQSEWGDAARWYNISVSGLVAAETLQLLEVIGGDWEGVVVVGTSPIILCGCGTTEFIRSANHERFPFQAPHMDRLLNQHGYSRDEGLAVADMPLGLWIERYLKGRNLEALTYEPYIYPTLAPWPPEKFESPDDFLRFYNDAPLNYEQSARINAELFDAIADWRDRTGIPVVLAELTLHGKALQRLDEIGPITSLYESFIHDFCPRREIPWLDLPSIVEITDDDFRDPAHIFQKRDAFTGTLIARAAKFARKTA